MEEPSSSSESPDCEKDTGAPKSKEASEAASDKCPVCLQVMKSKRKSYAPKCFHSFCYDCLLEWTKIKHNCPLCKRDLDRIVYEIESKYAFKEHYLTVDPEADERRRTMTLPLEIIGYRPATDPYDFFRRRAEHARVEPGAARDASDEEKLNSQHKACFLLNREAAPPEFRSLVYLNSWYANPTQTQANIQISQVDLDNSQEEVLDDSDQESIELAQTRQAIEDATADQKPLFVQYKLVSKFRTISPKWFKNNPASTHRIMQFIYRELKALAAIATQKYRLNQSARHTLLTKMIELIKQLDIKSEQFFLEIGPFIRPTRVARHFIHELHAYARSTCHDLHDYDASVVYYSKADFLSLEENVAESTKPQPICALPVNLNKYRLTERKNSYAPPAAPTRPTFNFFQNMPFAASVNMRVDPGPATQRRRSLVVNLRVLTPPPQAPDDAETTLSDSDHSSFCEEVAPSPKKSPEYIVVSGSEDESSPPAAAVSRSSSVLSLKDVLLSPKKRFKTESMEPGEADEESESRPGTSKELAERHKRKHRRKHHKHRHRSPDH